MRSTGSAANSAGTRRERALDDPLVRPGGPRHHRGGAVRPVMRQQRCDDAGQRVDREVDRERRARGGKGRERFPFRHRRGAARGARQNHRLRHLRQRQLHLQGRGGGGEGRHAGGHGVRDVPDAQAAELLPHGAPHRQIARMQPGDVVAGGVRRDQGGFDGIEVEGRRCRRSGRPGDNGRAARAAPASPRKGTRDSGRGGRGPAR